MKIGYAPVSTSEQVLDLQLDALRQAGYDDLFTDTVSGMKAHKPNWEKLLAYARAGDTVVIWLLDRLGCSTKHLIEVVEDLSRRGLHLISLQDPIDTTLPGGQRGCATRKCPPPSRNSTKPASSPPVSLWPISGLAPAARFTKFCASPAVRLTTPPRP